MHSSPSPPSSSSPFTSQQSTVLSSAGLIRAAHADGGGGEEEHVERAHHLLYLPLRPSSLLSFTLSLLKSITLSSCSRPAVNSPRIIVSMKGSNSERQFQQQYNNTGTPPLWAPILCSITPLCPSDTSGVSLQRLHQHTHTRRHTCTHTCTLQNTCTRSLTHNCAQTNPHI